HFCDQCGGLIIKSHKKKEIEAAVKEHYQSKCELFNVPVSDEE
ncbi:16069_t:CDS:1, partial [Acaulospora colombiana]